MMDQECPIGQYHLLWFQSAIAAIPAILIAVVMALWGLQEARRFLRGEEIERPL